MHTKRITFYLLPLALILSAMLACQFVSGNLPAESTATAPVPLPETPAAVQPTITPTEPSLSPATPEPIPPLTAASLTAVEYCLQELAYYHEHFQEVSEQGCFYLHDGKLSLQSTVDAVIRLTITLMDESAFGDLDGDGDGDAVALLAYNGGGSGTFFLLAAVINQAGQPEHIGSYGLGDRVIVQSIDYENGSLMIDYIGHGPEDGLCCPTQPMRVSLVYRRGALLDSVVDQVGPYADLAIRALQARDMAALSQLVHPVAGVRFSPYSYVLEDQLVFSSQQVAGLMQDTSVYLWGAYDGSGEPINLQFAEYYDRFVYSMDFAAAPQISYNQRLGYGNTLDNSREFYPDGVVVEYYFPGIDPQYGGMDWRSLRLVFQLEGDAWYLVGIISDQWTI